MIWDTIFNALTSRVAAVAYAVLVVGLLIVCGVTSGELELTKHQLATKTADLADTRADLATMTNAVKTQERSIAQLQGAVAMQNAALDGVTAAQVKADKAAKAAQKALEAKAQAADAQVAAILSTPVQSDPVKACAAADGVILDYARKLPVSHIAGEGET